MNKQVFKVKIVFFFFLQINFCFYFAQLPQNVNKVFGWQFSGTTQGVGSADWIYGVKSLPTGDFIATGYSLLGSVQNPIIIKLNSSGAVIWEQKYSCVDGYGLDIYDVPNGYLVIGEGTRSGGCGDPRSMFSIMVAKSTGVLDQGYGVKVYNDQTIPLPVAQNGQIHTDIGSMGTGKSRSCEIKNSGGQITGFMLCGNYNDNSLPAMTSVSLVTAGSFLLRLDLSGRPDPSFGNGGVQVVFRNNAGNCRNPHLHNVCVNYDGGGNPQGFVVVGAINEIPTVIPQWGWIDTDALYFMTNLVGSITYTDIYDETTHLKNTGTPLSFPYTDAADPPMCPSNVGGGPLPVYLLTQENNTEKATGVKQLINGGDFIVLSQFDHTLFNYSSACAATYPQTGFFGISDPCISRFDQSGNLLWATNVVQSSGADFENALLVTGAEVFVLGSTMMEPYPGTPADQQAIVSKLTPAGAILYEHVYDETANSQTMICPFSFDFDSTGGIIIAGDNDLNGDDYNFIDFSPY